MIKANVINVLIMGMDAHNVKFKEINYRIVNVRITRVLVRVANVKTLDAKDVLNLKYVYNALMMTATVPKIS